MSLDVWNEIIEEYKFARSCLWCPNHSGDWSRNENEGYYHLWRAYHLASSSEEKRPLWDARILYMMASEQRCKQNNHVILNTYLKPCMEAYAAAEKAGEEVTAEEKDAAEFLYKCYLHDVDNTCSAEENYKKACSRIDGLSEDVDFQFHDSQILSFSHDNSTAWLSLQYYETKITLQFENVYEINMLSVDPAVTWISEFNCYPTFHNEEQFIFDVGFYKIQCGKIKVLQLS